MTPGANPEHDGRHNARGHEREGSEHEHDVAGLCRLALVREGVRPAERDLDEDQREDDAEQGTGHRDDPPKCRGFSGFR